MNEEHEIQHEMRRYYNLAEANGLVPHLDYLFAELARVQRKVNSMIEAAEATGVDLSLERIIEQVPTLRRHMRHPLEEKLRNLSEEYLEIIDEIDDLGVVLCNIELGIVGFYSWFDGNEIFLSWQYGEGGVEHWHGISEDPLKRRSLLELLPDVERMNTIH